MINVLFVCLGNICRSPAAEGVMIHMLEQAGLNSLVKCDSAGTSAYHAGEPADSRMQLHAKKRGYNLPSISRQLTSEDFETFDYIITMDRSNYTNTLDFAPNEESKSKVIPMSHLCIEHSIIGVPDPYYGGDDGFEEVMDIVEDGCSALLEKIKEEKL